MASNGVHLFCSLQHFLAAKLFNDVEEVKTCPNHCFALKNAFFSILVRTYINRNRNQILNLSHLRYQYLRFHMVLVLSHVTWENQRL